MIKTWSWPKQWHIRKVFYLLYHLFRTLFKNFKLLYILFISFSVNSKFMPSIRFVETNVK